MSQDVRPGSQRTELAGMGAAATVTRARIITDAGAFTAAGSPASAESAAWVLDVATNAYVLTALPIPPGSTVARMELRAGEILAY